jgi:hypothetical protein
MDMPQLIEDKFLMNREMQVKIDCYASSSISDISSDPNNQISSESNASFTIQSKLQHTSKTLCIECPGTEYENEIKNISHEFSEAFKKQFDNLLNKSEENTQTICSNDI